MKDNAVVRGEIPDGKIAVGIPAKVIGDVSAQQKAEWQHDKDASADLARRRFPQGLKKIK